MVSPKNGRWIVYIWLYKSGYKILNAIVLIGSIPNFVRMLLLLMTNEFEHDKN